VCVSVLVRWVCVDPTVHFGTGPSGLLALRWLLNGVRAGAPFGALPNSCDRAYSENRRRVEDNKLKAYGDAVCPHVCHVDAVRGCSSDSPYLFLCRSARVWTKRFLSYLLLFLCVFLCVVLAA
jgi:hypothetical protein